jgi:hypothetical protein
MSIEIWGLNMDTGKREQFSFAWMLDEFNEVVPLTLSEAMKTIERLRIKRKRGSPIIHGIKYGR